MDPVCNDIAYSRIEPGIYEVRCVDCKIYKDPRFGRWVARLQFCGTSETFTIYAFLNLGDGEKPVPGRGSKYREVWAMVNRQAPRRGRPMPASIFVDQFF